jgi:ribosomal protein S26
MKLPKISNVQLAMIALIVFLLSYDLILQLTTQFSKTITIQDKYIVPGYKNKTRYTIVDKDFNVYTIDNAVTRGEFDKASDYSRVQIGRTYKVEGYGVNLPSVGVFKRIYKIKNM